MALYSENQIRNWYAEFRNLKKYIDKISYYDRIFGIIPFDFPDFDPQLKFLLDRDQTEDLIDILKRERNNPGLTEKRFMYREPVIFNISPANSNSAVYSHYILSSFLSRSPEFAEWIRKNKTAEKPIEAQLDEANGLVNKIEWTLHNDYDKTFRLQFLSVFYKGFSDAFTNSLARPDKKRKFIELFLYAQGIIYSNYVTSLKAALYKERNPAEFLQSHHLDLQGKLELLVELGVVEFLKNRYSAMDPVSFARKLAEVLCIIMGEEADQTELVLKILTEQEGQISNPENKKLLPVVHRNIQHFFAMK